MGRTYSDMLEKNDCVGTGSVCFVYNISPSIVVKTVRVPRSQTTVTEHHPEHHPFLREINFYKCVNKRQDRCPDIVECFLALPDHLFLSFCDLNNLSNRFSERQTRETLPDGWPGRLISVDEYEDVSLIARGIQQVTSALEYVEKMGFSHNDVHPRNCLLDRKLNLKLSDFDCATTVGQFLQSSYAPWSRRIPAGPLEGSYGLCSARTEQFAVGTLLYFMLYGHEPYGFNLKDQDEAELERRFQDMEFPELNRLEVLDGLISACWYNVYPTMALLAYDFKCKTKHMASGAEYSLVDSSAERKTCEVLIQKGLLGPELAYQFRPLWQRYLHFTAKRCLFVWESLINLTRRFSTWSLL